MSRASGLHAALIVAALGFPSVAVAQSGSWITGTPGTYNWSDAANWQGGVIADGADNTANFPIVGLNGSTLVNLDAPRTIGSMVFGNSSWAVVGSSSLTLSSAGGGPVIAVNSNGTTQISNPLAGNQGITKTGPGFLFLTGDNSGLTGGITVAAGSLVATRGATVNPLGSNAITLSGILQLGEAPNVVFSGGYNQKMVVPAGTTFATSGITATMDGGTAVMGYTWYQRGQNTSAPSTGLPTGQTVSSFPNPTQYTLQPATSNNAILLDASHLSSTIALTVPVALSTVSFLTSSGNGTGTVSATLHFADGAPDATGLNFTSPDWTTSGSGFGPYGRISAGGNDTSSGSLYSESITVPAGYAGHPVRSIDLSWSGGSNTHTAVFAVTGTAAVPIEQNFGANNLTITGSSQIDVLTPAGGSMGNLSIGTNLLISDGALAFSAVSLKGNPTFIVLSGSTLAPGPFSDGGTLRTITMGATPFNGGGTLTISNPSSELSAGTGVVVTFGTVNLNSAIGFGPSPNMTINGGTVNLRAGLNPNFASLAGTPGGTIAGSTSPGGGVAGNLILNGNTLTLGGGTASYAGTIQDGSAPGALVKTGSGTQSLSGISSFSGGITINSGRLAATTVGALGAGTVALNGGVLSVGGGSIGLTTLNYFGNAANWTSNGSATFAAPNTLFLTSNGNNQAGTAWFNTPVSTRQFTLSFTYTVTAAGSRPADGFTVGFQSQGPSALGGGGSDFGFSYTSPSAAVAFNIDPSYTVGGVGSGVELLVNGTYPYNSVVPSAAPINMAAVNSPTNVAITYDGANVHVHLVQGTNALDLPAMPLDVGGNTGPSAYFGFTGASGTATQQITNLQFTSTTPTAYTNSVVVAATPSTIQVAATPAVPAVSLGNISFLVPNSTLNVTADPGTAANQPFNLTLGTTILNGATILNVANNGAGAGTLTVGPVNNGPGAGSLIKTDFGTLVLGAGGTYSGGTTINGGTLRAANPTGSATGSGPVTVANGGTLAGGDGGGSANPFADSTQGFIAGPVTVQNGGILAPGSSVGLLTVSNNVTFESSSTFAVQLGTNVPEPGNVALVDNNSNDRIHTALDVLFGSTLTLDIDGMGQSFTNGLTYAFFLGRADGSIGPLPVMVMFDPSDFGNASNPADFALSVSPDGHELILTYTPTAVPEPGSLALVAAASIGFVRVLRRRRR